jgi:hypothetical protein
MAKVVTADNSEYLSFYAEENAAKFLTWPRQESLN